MLSMPIHISREKKICSLSNIIMPTNVETVCNEYLVEIVLLIKHVLLISVKS